MMPRMWFSISSIGSIGSIGLLLPAAWGFLLAMPTHVSTAPVELRFVDDRGETIARPLEVCLQLELRSDCTEVAGGACR